MAWVAIDSTAPDSSDTTKTKGGKWVPIASAPARQGPATAGQIAKQAGQNIAVQGAGIAPIVAGAELGGALSGPFAPVGAVVGAGLGAMAGPSARYYMGKLVGSKQAEPTMAEANREGNIGAFTEAVGPVASKVAGKAANAIIDPRVGKSDLGQVGTDAAQATEQANLADKQKLQEAATKEATKQKKATATAAETQGQANLAQRADAAKVTAEKQTGFQQAQETVKAKADADFEKQGKKLREQIVPEARQETVAGALGKTPEQTRDDSVRSERATDASQTA